MALLAFDLPGTGSDGRTAPALEAPPHIAELLSPSQKLRTAGELNAAILASQSQGCDPKLPQMLRLMTYGEELLGPEGPGKMHFPRLDVAAALGKAPPAPADPSAAAAAAAEARMDVAPEFTTGRAIL